MLVCKSCEEKPDTRRCGSCLVCTHINYANKTDFQFFLHNSCRKTSDWKKIFALHMKFHAAAFTNTWDMIIPFMRTKQYNHWHEVAVLVDNPELFFYSVLEYTYRNFVHNYVTKPWLFYIQSSTLMRRLPVLTFKSTKNILSFLEVTKFSRHNTSLKAFLNRYQFGFILCVILKMSDENLCSFRKIEGDKTGLSNLPRFHRIFFRILLKSFLYKKVLLE